MRSPQNAFQLGVCRFVLGVGEGGCFPGAAKGVAEWFPQTQRALAIGIAIGGSASARSLAPPHDGLAGRRRRLARRVPGHRA